jgi:putative SOS response-associated peptidase YedK
VPATGFYEPDKITYTKQPFPWHYFQLTDQSLFGLAGLYDIWKDKQKGKDIWSYTIITVTPDQELLIWGVVTGSIRQFHR